MCRWWRTTDGHAHDLSDKPCGSCLHPLCVTPVFVFRKAGGGIAGQSGSWTPVLIPAAMVGSTREPWRVILSRTSVRGCVPAAWFLVPVTNFQCEQARTLASEASSAAAGGSAPFTRSPLSRYVASSWAGGSSHCVGGNEPRCSSWPAGRPCGWCV